MSCERLIMFKAALLIVVSVGQKITDYILNIVTCPLAPLFSSLNPSYDFVLNRISFSKADFNIPTNRVN